jgi:hypothetical protein
MKGRSKYPPNVGKVAWRQYGSRLQRYRDNLINLVDSGEAVKMGRSYQSNAFEREYGHSKQET